MTRLFILSPDKTIRVIIEHYGAEGDARKALLPSPLGGSCQAAEPNEDDYRTASQSPLGPMDHIHNDRHLAYGIVAGRPLGSIASHTKPQPRIQIEAQLRALREFIKTQLESLNNATLRMDLSGGWVSMKRCG